MEKLNSTGIEYHQLKNLTDKNSYFGFSPHKHGCDLACEMLVKHGSGVASLLRHAPEIVSLSKRPVGRRRQS
jgi:hypothetical protein